MKCSACQRRPKHYRLSKYLNWAASYRIISQRGETCLNESVDRLLHDQILADPSAKRFELDLQLLQNWTQDLIGGKSKANAAIRPGDHESLNVAILHDADHVPNAIRLIT